MLRTEHFLRLQKLVPILKCYQNPKGVFNLGIGKIIPFKFLVTLSEQHHIC